MMAALNHLGKLVFHVVAEIVEAELIVGAIGDVGGIGAAAFVVIEAMHDDPGRKAEEMINASHPFGVAAGEIIVDGDDMDALARERVEIGGERRDKGLAFAGAHLGDRALMQNHPANELNIEMPLAEDAARRFPYRCESRHEQLVKALAGGEFLPEHQGSPRKFGIGELQHFGLERVDSRDFRPVSLEPAIVRRSENLFREGAQHYETTFLENGRNNSRPSALAPSFSGWILRDPRGVAQGAVRA